MADASEKENLPLGQPSSAQADKSPAQDFADVPDPDEDDLDDLDDLLGDFSATKLDAPKPSAVSGPGRPPVAPSEDDAGADVLSEDDFAKELQAGMADLLGEIENSPEMKAQLDSIFGSLAAETGAGTAPPVGPSARANQPGAGAEASFQETIRQTMERMQASGEQATAAAAAGSSDDFFAELMKQMGEGAGEGVPNEEEFGKMLLGMMEQLTNKEILYEPMKELSGRFRPWLEANRDKTPADQFKKYEEQERLALEMVAKFEEPTYADTNSADRDFIVDRMQKMQEAGNPPAEIMGDMPSAQDALNAPEESCNPQ